VSFFLAEALFAADSQPLLTPEISPDSQGLNLFVIAELQATVSADHPPLLAPRNSSRTAEFLISVATQGSGMGFTPLVCASDGSWAKLDWVARQSPRVR
jgi:hypothetical protein